MPMADTQRLSFDQILAEHGEWSAMAVHLGEGRYTRQAAPDWRLRRILQIVADTLGKPFAQARVLDLACLEGQYGIEFAMQGATEVLGIEIRDANIVKAQYAQQELGLTNVRFLKDDVRNLSRARHGGFDVVIASGILYHLDTPAVFDFARAIYDVCDRVAIIDTQIALNSQVTVDLKGHSYSGLWYHEHEEGADQSIKNRDLWASVDNTRSLWLTHASLCNLMADVGFTSLLRVELPEMPQTADDRQTYVALKGTRVASLSSPPTASLVGESRPEQNKVLPNPIQIQRGVFFRAMKKALPQPVKDAIKPGLRALRILPPDGTPSFLKRRP